MKEDYVIKYFLFVFNRFKLNMHIATRSRTLIHIQKKYHLIKNVADYPYEYKVIELK